MLKRISENIYTNLFLVIITFVISCTTTESDPRMPYTGIFEGEILYLEQSNNPINGPLYYDSTYAETIVVQPQGMDSLRITSQTFGEQILPFLAEEEYLITFGSHAAFTCRFAAGGDSLYMHSYAYSGIGPSNYYQLDMDFAGSR